MFFRQIEDRYLAEFTYLIGCQRTKQALVIDPERDIDRYIQLSRQEDLTIATVAETHIHADFLSGAREFAHHHGATVYLSDEGDADWKYAWADDPRYHVRLLKGGNTFTVGNIEVKAIHTPGHTPEHLSFLVTDRGGGADEPMGIVSGDFIFVGDIGRPDLLETAAGNEGVMKPSAKRLYRSVVDFLEMNDYLQVWPGHGAGSACGKALGAVPETTVGYERRFSPALAAAREGESAFVEYVLEGQPAPPLYFARMKQLNKEGPPLLEWPEPERLEVGDLFELAGNNQIALLDARLDRAAVMREHVPGAIFAPFNKTFPTIAGSYVDPDVPLYLIVRKEDLDEAVRCLIRVGLDRVEGYATPETFKDYVEQGGHVDSIDRVDFVELERLRIEEGVHVLDVRGPGEYAESHLPGAQLIPHTRLAAHVDEVPLEATVFVHCGSGARASAAASLLRRYDRNVVLVDDVFSNWSVTHPAEL